jgi:hypothetical protein
MFDGTTRPIDITDKMTRLFWARVSKPDGEEGCWEWTGARAKTGYGVLNPHFAHRYSYTLHAGPIPERLVIDHLCRNPPCVNPAHLEAVTNRENVRRGLAFSPSGLCKNGHPLDGTQQTGRYCKTCSTDRSLSAYQRRRAMGMSVTEARYGSPVKPRRRAS